MINVKAQIQIKFQSVQSMQFVEPPQENINFQTIIKINLWYHDKNKILFFNWMFVERAQRWKKMVYLLKIPCIQSWIRAKKFNVQSFFSVDHFEDRKMFELLIVVGFIHFPLHSFSQKWALQSIQKLDKWMNISQLNACNDDYLQCTYIQYQNYKRPDEY